MTKTPKSNVRPLRSQPPKPIYGAQPVGDPVLDAAANCVARKGLDNTSLEEVAAEAGISRTTIYRRYGNREALFAALVEARSAPFKRWADAVLTGPGSVAERLETVIVHAILEMQRVRWLDVSFRGGISPLSGRLLKASYKTNPNSGLQLFVHAILSSRTDHDGAVDAEEVLDWIMEQMLVFAGAKPWDEEELRQRVRFFVVPPLAAGRAVQPTHDRLEAIERKLDAVLRKTKRS